MSRRIAVIVALMTAGVAMATPVNAQKAKQQSLRMASSEVRNELYYMEYLHVCVIFVAVEYLHVCFIFVAVDEAMRKLRRSTAACHLKAGLPI